MLRVICMRAKAQHKERLSPVLQSRGDKTGDLVDSAPVM